MKIYNAFDWYWIVGGNIAQVYSSKTAVRNYVPASDPAFVAWSTDGSLPTKIDTESNLGAVLGEARTEPPIPPAILEAYKDILVRDAGMTLDHENRIRVLEGQPPLSSDDFITQAINPAARPPPS